MKIKNLEDGGYYLGEKSYGNLISLGEIYLKKENKKNESYCTQLEDRFNYHGIKKALCGKAGYLSEDKFTLKRIVVIQMK